LDRITPAGARIYEILHHPEAFTVQTIAAAEHIKGQHQAKVVMVKSGGQHLMTVLPADHRADLQKLEKIAGEPASLETEEKFESLFPTCAKGAMRPFGNLYGLPTCVDKRLTQEDYIVFEAGTHSDAIKLSDRGHEEIVKPARRRPGDQGAYHPATLRLQVKKIGVQCGCELPASRTRGPGALGSNGQVMSVPATTRITDASPTTSSTYYLG
jgi:Ala-tRNA(Pro) deacylase